MTLVFAAVCVSVSSVAGQDADVVTAPARSQASVSLGIRRTPIRGSATTFLGGDLMISPRSSGFSVGLAGWILPNNTDIRGAASESDLTLGVAYGGLQLQHRVGVSEQGGWGVRVLLGAGNAKVSLRAVDTEIAADNFGVVEPEVFAERQIGPLRLRGHLGYRLVYGVEDLPQVVPSQLRGLSTTVSIGLGPF